MLADQVKRRPCRCGGGRRLLREMWRATHSTHSCSGKNRTWLSANCPNVSFLD